MEKSQKSKKILKRVGITIAILLPLIIVYLIYSYHLTTIEYPQKEVTVNSENPNGLKMLIVYQPSGKEGQSNYPEDVVKKIADGAVQKGTSVTIIRPNKATDINVNDYDIFVFGTPWYMGPSLRLTEMMNSLNFSGKKVCLFIVQGDPFEVKSRFNALKKVVKDVEIAEQTFFGHYFYSESKALQELEKAKDWGKKIGSK